MALLYFRWSRICLLAFYSFLAELVHYCSGWSFGLWGMYRIWLSFLGDCCLSMLYNLSLDSMEEVWEIDEFSVLTRDRLRRLCPLAPGIVAVKLRFVSDLLESLRRIGTISHGSWFLYAGIAERYSRSDLIRSYEEMSFHLSGPLISLDFSRRLQSW